MNANEQKSIVLRTPSYQVGDGKTRITEDWGSQLTSEEKHQIGEIVREVGNVLHDLALALASALKSANAEGLNRK